MGIYFCGGINFSGFRLLTLIFDLIVRIVREAIVAQRFLKAWVYFSGGSGVRPFSLRQSAATFARSPPSV
jgi:hypothetical protein